MAVPLAQGRQHKVMLRLCTSLTQGGGWGGDAAGRPHPSLRPQVSVGMLGMRKGILQVLSKMLTRLISSLLKTCFPLIIQHSSYQKLLFTNLKP